MSFLILRSDVIKPCAATEEPAEHEFGMLRDMIREFTTLEFVRLSQKSKLRLKTILRGNLNPGTHQTYGYMESFSDWIESCRKSASNQNGPVNVEENSNSSTAEQLWKELKPLLNGCCDMMRRFFICIG